MDDMTCYEWCKVKQKWPNYQLNRKDSLTIQVSMVAIGFGQIQTKTATIEDMVIIMV